MVKAIFLGNAQAVSQGIQAIPARLRNGDHLQLVGMVLGKSAVDTAPAAGAENDSGDGFHKITSLFRFFLIRTIKNKCNNIDSD